MLALFGLGSRWFGRPAGVAAALLAAVTPVMLGLEHTLQPDFLFGACVFAGAALLVLGTAPERTNDWLVVAAGVAFAAGTYVKPVGVAVVLGVAIGLWAGTRSLREAAVGTGLVVAVLGVLLVPWVVRNQVEYGDLTLSTQGGQTPSSACSTWTAATFLPTPPTAGSWPGSRGSSGAPIRPAS